MPALLAPAFADRIARRRGQEGRYQLANGMGAMLNADDALGRHEWLIAPLLLQGSSSPDARILLAQPLDITALLEQLPDLAQRSDTVEWDEAQGTLKAWRRTCIGQLVIKTQPLAKPSEEELHRAMLNGIREKGLSVLNWTAEAEQLRLRLHCAAQWLPEEAWPAVDEASLLATLEAWLLPQMSGVHSLRALRALDIRQALQNWLPWPLRQKLDSELPTHYVVPTGSRIAIRYHEENPPALAVRMQEMFGEATTPTIAQGGWRWCWSCCHPPSARCRSPAISAPSGRGLSGSAKRDEGTLPQTRLAGRSGKRRGDPAHQKVCAAGIALRPATTPGSTKTGRRRPAPARTEGQRPIQRLVG
nr:ATP-dependent helicase HrpB [Raoultella sp. NCTC 9187]